jgi:hypothetical protein
MDINEKIKRFTVSDEEAEQALDNLLENYNLQNRIFDRFMYVMTIDYYEISEELCLEGEISEDQKSRLQCSLLKLKRQVVRYCIEESDKNKLQTKIKDLTEYFKRIKATLSPRLRKLIEQNIKSLHFDLIKKFERLKFEQMDLSSIESLHQPLVKQINKKHPEQVWFNPTAKRFEFNTLTKKKKKTKK